MRKSDLLASTVAAILLLWSQGNGAVDGNGQVHFPDRACGIVRGDAKKSSRHLHEQLATELVITCPSAFRRLASTRLPCMKSAAIGTAPAAMSLALLSKSNSTSSPLAALGSEVTERLPERTIARYVPGARLLPSTDTRERPDSPSQRTRRIALPASRGAGDTVGVATGVGADIESPQPLHARLTRPTPATTASLDVPPILRPRTLRNVVNVISLPGLLAGPALRLRPVDSQAT